MRSLEKCLNVILCLMRGALPSATLDLQVSEATEGVDKTTRYYLLLFHPLPTTWYSPLSQGEKVDARSLQEYCDYNFTPRQQIVPLRQGDEERSDGGGG